MERTFAGSQVGSASAVAMMAGGAVRFAGDHRAEVAAAVEGVA